MDEFNEDITQPQRDALAELRRRSDEPWKDFLPKCTLGIVSEPDVVSVQWMGMVVLVNPNGATQS